MSHTLSRRNISALAKLDFGDLGHAQRIDLIAKSLGYATGAALMGTLKSAETQSSDEEPKKFRAVMAFGSELTRCASDFSSITDSYGDIVSGDLSLLEFDTKAELIAYSKGVEDAEGWMDAYTFASEEDDPNHPIFEALKTQPDLPKAYEIARAAYWSEDDEGED